VVWNVVSELVTEFKVDLIVLGTHGGLRHLVLGSVAEQILRRVPRIDCRPRSARRAGPRETQHDRVCDELFPGLTTGSALRASPSSLVLAD
jgi:hypothetical protein